MIDSFLTQGAFCVHVQSAFGDTMTFYLFIYLYLTLYVMALPSGNRLLFWPTHLTLKKFQVKKKIILKVGGWVCDAIKFEFGDIFVFGWNHPLWHYGHLGHTASRRRDKCYFIARVNFNYRVCDVHEHVQKHVWFGKCTFWLYLYAETVVFHLLPQGSIVHFDQHVDGETHEMQSYLPNI